MNPYRTCNPHPCPPGKNPNPPCAPPLPAPPAPPCKPTQCVPLPPPYANPPTCAPSHLPSFAPLPHSPTPGMDPDVPEEIGTCLGDLYSVSWMENSEVANLTAETLKVRVCGGGWGGISEGRPGAAAAIKGQPDYGLDVHGSAHGEGAARPGQGATDDLYCYGQCYVMLPKFL